MLENVALLSLLIHVDEVERIERSQVLLDRIESSELRIGTGQHRRLEHASEDACHLEDLPRGLVELIDAAQDQAVQAFGKIESL